MFGVDHRPTQPQQCIEILGSQTLWQLQQAIYCVHTVHNVHNVHNVHGSGESGSSSSGGDNNGIHRHNSKDKDAFFCIDGQIYAQLCRPTTHASSHGHEVSCTCGNNTTTTASASTSSSSNSQLNATNDYVPGTEPVRALMWMYRSLFGITLPGTTEDTTNTSTITNLIQNNNTSNTTSGNTNTAGTLTTNQRLIVNNSSSTREEAEQIIFVNTNDLPPTSAKAKRSRPAKITTVNASDIYQQTSTSVGNVLDTSSASNVNGELTAAKTKGKKRNNNSADPTTTSATTATSTITNNTAPRGRKKAATTHSTSSSRHVNTTTSVESDNTARLQHPYDFQSLRTAVTSSSATIEMKCVFNVRLVDINFTLGVPYLYTHACGCEHIVYITNVRTFSPKYDSITPTLELPLSSNTQFNAVSNGNGYPVETFRARHKQKRCAVCEVLPAVCVVFEDRLAEHNPMLYCE